MCDQNSLPFRRLTVSCLLLLSALCLCSCRTLYEPLVLSPGTVREGPGMADFFVSDHPVSSYQATTDHLHVGFRWQPSPGRPACAEYDINRELGSVASYASFWFMGLHTLPSEKNLDYANHASSEALAIRNAIRLCKERGIQTELVIWQVPLWMNGGSTYEHFNRRPEHPEQIYDMVRKTVEWFGDDVDYYGIFHEANHPGYWSGSWKELMEFFMLPAARAIRDYEEATGDLKVVSTAGLSPSLSCKRWYREQLKYPELMNLIDNFALNLSDYSNGYGGGGFTRVKSCWDQVDYMRKVLDKAGYPGKGLAAAESWVCWDGDRTPNRPEVSGDTVEATLRILGECLQRGLSLANLPWADNNSTWSMGLTKRLDYNGSLARLGEELYPNAFGGAPIATRKLNLMGGDENLSIDNEREDFEDAKFAAPYAVTDDPRHTHYYIWRWFAQLSAGHHECVHHAIAGEEGNDIEVEGLPERDLIRISSYDRTAKRFIVLLARKDADPGPVELRIKLPAQIRKGARYHRNGTFVGEGFAEGSRYRVRWSSDDIDARTGYRQNSLSGTAAPQTVDQGSLTITIPAARRLTTLVFEAL